MEIEEGKYYLTRGGATVGPLREIQQGVWAWRDPEGRRWSHAGRWIATGRTNDLDLVSEAAVRTVTRQEIVPGTYDGVVVEFGTRDTMIHVNLRNPSADELTRAAAVLTALAEALRDGE